METPSGRINNRLDEVAVLRTFAVIAVVLYHAFWLPYLSISFKINAVETPLNSFYDAALHNWLGARMPLFIFISGYLFSYLLNKRGKYASIPEFIKKKFCRLIIPYVIFAVLIGLSLGVLTWEGFLEGFAHLWFILMLFWCFMAARIFALIKSATAHFALLAFSSLWGLIPVTEYLAFNNFLRCFAFFWLGYVVLLHKDKLRFLFETRFIVMLFVVWFSCCMYIQYTTTGAYSVAFRHNVVALVYTYFSYISFVLMVYALTCKLLAGGVIKVGPWVDNFNKCSYGIYVFHLWIMGLLLLRTNVFVPGNEYSLFVKNHAVIFPLLLFVFAIICSHLLTRLFLRTSVGRFLIG